MTRHIILLCILLLLPAAALAQTLVLTDNTPTTSAVPFLSILEDPGQQLTLEQATSAEMHSKFTPYTENIKNLGLRDSAWWLRLELERTDNMDTGWHARFTVPLLTSESDAYIISENHSVPIPLSNMQDKPSQLRLYTLKLPEINKFSLILRLNNHGDALIHFPLQLIDRDHLYKEVASDHFLYGGIVISLLVLAVYNLFLFFSLQNHAYLSLAAYLIASIFLLQRTTNIIPLLSFLNDPTTFYHSFNIQLVLISSLQFWRQLVNSKKSLPYLDKVAVYLLVIMISITPFISYLPYSNSWPLVMTAIVLITLTAFSVFTIRKSPFAKVNFLLAFITTIISAVPITICSFGLFLDKIEIALDVYNIGVLCATILMSFTLAEHNRQLRVQATHATMENKAKDSFLATMSHELRTPMHTTTSIIHLLKDTPLSEQQKNYTNKLETSAKHMLGLINSVLDLSRSKSNELKLEQQPFKLKDILIEINQIIGEEAIKKRLSLKLIINGEKKDQVLIGDMMRLKQILLNLLSNAIKFTWAGEVTLIINPLNNSKKNLATFQFTTTDTGIGISNSQKKRIFEAFSQADSDTTRKYGGSGLGLAISSQIIKHMGGTLQLESTIDQGSRFFFTLTFPVSHFVEPEITHPLEYSTPVPDNICILLVEDDNLNRMLGYELLTMMGFTCVTACDGQDALKQLLKHPIDLIFMDISMPKMDGYETTLKIRENPQYNSLPIIALTAHSIEAEKGHHLVVGMNDLLCKPFDPDTLKEKALFWVNKDKAITTAPLTQ